MTWVHPYREGMIQVDGTINGTRPGHAIAKSITELQERCVNAIEIVSPDGSITHSESINNNVLRITIAVSNPVPQEEDDPYRNDPGGGGGSLSIPEGGEAGMVLTLRVSDGGERSTEWDWVRAIS
jgi:hypothetical protein